MPTGQSTPPGSRRGTGDLRALRLLDNQGSKRAGDTRADEQDGWTPQFPRRADARGCRKPDVGPPVWRPVRGPVRVSGLGAAPASWAYSLVVARGRGAFLPRDLARAPGAGARQPPVVPLWLAAASDRLAAADGRHFLWRGDPGRAGVEADRQGSAAPAARFQFRQLLDPAGAARALARRLPADVLRRANVDLFFRALGLPALAQEAVAASRIDRHGASG